MKKKKKINLPSSTHEEVIIGGNYAQFGSYGKQETVQYTKLVMNDD